MNRFLWGIYLMFLATGLTAHPSPDMDEAFEFACSVLDYPCEGIEPPKLRLVDGMYQRRGNVGEYGGGDYIDLDAFTFIVAPEAYTQATLAHEVVHYLDVQLGYLVMPAPTKEQLCASEWRAWRVDNAYTTFVGRSDLSDFTWAQRYGCFRA